MNANIQNKIAKILTEAKNGNEKKVNDIFNSFINKKITMENLEICAVLLVSKDNDILHRFKRWFPFRFILRFNLV